MAEPTVPIPIHLPTCVLREPLTFSHNLLNKLPELREELKAPPFVPAIFVQNVEDIFSNERVIGDQRE